MKDKFSLIEDRKMISDIEDIILEIVDSSEGITRSDLQGICAVKALDIANIVLRKLKEN